MKSNILYHNPRCSKSRQALELLNSKNINFKINEYLKNGLTKTEIKKLLTMLKISPLDGLIRQKESILTDSAIDLKTLNSDELITLISKNPILLERPIFVFNGKAVIGRPPERILELI